MYTFIVAKTDATKQDAMKHAGLPLLLATVLFCGCDSPPKTTCPPKPSVSSEDVVRDAVPDETVELAETYVDSQYGFRFNYPSHWVEVEFDPKCRVTLCDEDTASTVSVAFVSTDPNLLYITPDIIQESHEKAGLELVREITFKRMKFDSRDCVFYHAEFLHVESDMELVYMQYLIDHPEKTMLVGFCTRKEFFDDMDYIFDAIIASFKLEQHPPDPRNTPIHPEIAKAHSQ